MTTWTIAVRLVPPPATIVVPGPWVFGWCRRLTTRHRDVADICGISLTALCSLTSGETSPWRLSSSLTRCTFTSGDQWRTAPYYLLR
jgi:hypothetical protein